MVHITKIHPKSIASPPSTLKVAGFGPFLFRIPRVDPPRWPQLGSVSRHLQSILEPFTESVPWENPLGLEIWSNGKGEGELDAWKNVLMSLSSLSVSPLPPSLPLFD